MSKTKTTEIQELETNLKQSQDKVVLLQQALQAALALKEIQK